ncbi:hypothetical protein T07_13305 [Trichinella nelsoni]|uniref:Uncharacterized protein n=1 Tax=Trichinella nelsoni TaxID=6336 RepID=A0A0V0RDE6_9BILA|nr:hypothetical protein T07_13305 [Trichinella nelsoni]
MKTGGFALKKWASNDPDALMDLPPEDVSSADEDRLWKTLGLHWNRHSDHLTFMPMPDIHPERHDYKRQLLSLASRLFNPLGCLAPFTIRAKKLFQSLWLKGLDWDDQLPLDINSVWCQWKRELETLDSVRSPTRVDGHSKSVWRRGIPDDGVHGRGEGGKILPRQDPRRSGQAMEPLTARIDGCTPPGAPQRLDLRRPTKVQTFCGEPRSGDPQPQFRRHCPTADNPADKHSRGCALDTLCEAKLWWNGPAWLKEPIEQWPRLTMALSPEETRLVSPERKRVVTFCASLQEPSLFCDHRPVPIWNDGTSRPGHGILLSVPRECETPRRRTEDQSPARRRFRFRRPPRGGPSLCELGTPLRLCLHSWTRKAFCEWEEDTALVPPSSLLPLNGPSCGVAFGWFGAGKQSRDASELASSA